MDGAQTEHFLRLLARHQEQLFRYLYSLLLNEEDSKDVLQETYIALCRKFADYDETKPFLPWAYRFAYLEVLKHRERNKRKARCLSDEVIESLAHEREAYSEDLAARLKALDTCLEKLPEADRRLIQHRYHQKTKVDELARELGSSHRTLFRNLDRIRRLLFDCITRRVAEEQKL